MRPARRFDHKFLDALRGLRAGVHGQSSFLVHALATAAVLGTAWYLRVPRHEWAVLVLCITIVWAAELFNSALEALAAAVRTDYDPQIGKALDVASSAVLVAALGAAAVGTVLLGYRVGLFCGWWGNEALVRYPANTHATAPIQPIPAVGSGTTDTPLMSDAASSDAISSDA
ncbi:MAG: diacylglycerol kinase family protein [Pirellulales bacterium]